MIRIISTYTTFKNPGGAEKVLFKLHNFFKKQGYEVYAASFDNYEDIKNKVDILNDEFINIKKLLTNDYLKNSIVLSHHRKVTTFLKLLNLFENNFKLIHIAHSVFYNLKYFTLFPCNNITVSEAVKRNMIEYFKVKEKNITCIYNGIEDKNKNLNQLHNFNKDEIKIIYPARICKVKMQLELVDYLKDKLDKRIKIYFAGDGEDTEELKEKLKNLSNFIYLGKIENLNELYHEYNFNLLYSEKEGLGLTLVEACMFGIPSIIRNLEACKEVIIDQYNGFVVKKLDELLQTLNNLPNLSEDEYINLCKNARKVYEEKFTEEKMFSEYLNYIKNIEENWNRK